MVHSSERLYIEAIESKEAAHEQVNLTAYLMRHGESESDKTKDNRGLTEKGKQEVDTNFNEILDQIIQDELPDFNEMDNPDERKKLCGKQYGMWSCI